jgi:hypothetical protein
MADLTKIKKINSVIEAYFAKNTSVTIIPAKELMPDFIRAGIFAKDRRKGLPIREILRDLDRNNQLKLIPYVHAERKEKNTYWYFIPSNKPKPITPYKQEIKKTIKTSSFRKYSDETYVIDLCDLVLGQPANRQKRFDFLLGDLHKDGKTRTMLPVDAYYESLNLVIEFMEKQHTEDVAFFDKPDVMTISGVSRDEQRKIYDQRRRELIPKNGIDLVIISYDDFKYDNKKKIIRDKENDLKVVRNILKDYVKETD